MTDRELDALVAEKVMGYDPSETDPEKWKWWNPHELPFGRRVAVPGPYSTDIAAAWEVVEKMTAMRNMPAWSLHIWNDHRFDEGRARYPHKYGVQLSGGKGWGGPEADADTAPRAICLAALKAVGVKVPR